MAESRRKKRTLLFPILPLLFSAFLPVVAHASVEGEADDQKSELVSSNLSTNEKEGQEHSDSESQPNQGKDSNTSSSSTPVDPALYNKTYEFISGTPNKTLPPEVLKYLPQNQENIQNGTRAIPELPKENQTEIQVPGGKWIFKGYDKDAETIQDKDAHFIGKWEFEKEPKQETSTSSKEHSTSSKSSKKAKTAFTLTLPVISSLLAILLATGSFFFYRKKKQGATQTEAPATSPTTPLKNSQKQNFKAALSRFSSMITLLGFQKRKETDEDSWD